MIVNELENMELEATIREKFAKSILSHVANLPDGLWEYFLYQMDTDPTGLFIKYYLLSVDAGEPNTNLEELMCMWNVSEKQFDKYHKELIQEGWLEIDD